MNALEKPGLRERKKIKTREAIRREAFRLFEKHGYANTTVEQIAEAADVSPRTFFRYFASKEYVLLSDSLSLVGPIIDAFIDAPPGLPPIEAYRHAVEVTFGAMSDDERENIQVGQRLMYSIPEARGLLYSEYTRLIMLITDGLTHRLRRPADAFERRVLAGAIVGVLIAVSHDTPMPDDPILRALDLLAAGLPLGQGDDQ